MDRLVSDIGRVTFVEVHCVVQLMWSVEQEDEFLLMNALRSMGASRETIDGLE